MIKKQSKRAHMASSITSRLLLDLSMLIKANINTNLTKATAAVVIIAACGLFIPNANDMLLAMKSIEEW